MAMHKFYLNVKVFFSRHMQHWHKERDHLKQDTMLLLYFYIFNLVKNGAVYKLKHNHTTQIKEPKLFSAVSLH